jgi:hypothetical protein
LDSSYKKLLIISQLSIDNIEEKRALIFNSLNFRPGRIGGIKQAIQGLFTAGTSEKKEKVGGKRGLTPWFVSHGTSVCPNNPAGTN